MNIVKEALLLATKAHKGQTRWKGEPYITHPLRVADNFKDDIHKAVAILHDVLEDTAVTVDDLYNFPLEVMRNVVILTKQKEESYLLYILKVKKSPIAKAVKIADIEDNLIGTTKSLKAKYELALYILKKEFVV